MDVTEETIDLRQAKKNLWRKFLANHIDSSTTTLITWVVTYVMVINVTMVVIARVFLDKDISAIGIIAALAGFATPYIAATAARKGVEKVAYIKSKNGKAMVPEE